MRPLLLLADGDLQRRNLYRHFLTQQGYAVDVARDGLDCMEKLRSAEPDALVLDEELTWGGGDGVLDCLLSEHPRCRIPVVFTAAAGRAPSAPEAEDLPAIRFLAKPFTLPDLERCVRTVVADGGRYAERRRPSVTPTEIYFG